MKWSKPMFCGETKVYALKTEYITINVIHSQRNRFDAKVYLLDCSVVISQVLEAKTITNALAEATGKFLYYAGIQCKNRLRQYRAIEVAARNVNPSIVRHLKKRATGYEISYCDRLNNYSSMHVYGCKNKALALSTGMELVHWGIAKRLSVLQGAIRDIATIHKGYK